MPPVTGGTSGDPVPGRRIAVFRVIRGELTCISEGVPYVRDADQNYSEQCLQSQVCPVVGKGIQKRTAETVVGGIGAEKDPSRKNGKAITSENRGEVSLQQSVAVRPAAVGV